MDWQTAIVATVSLAALAPLLLLLKETASRAVRAGGVLAWLVVGAVVTSGADEYRAPLEAAELAPVTGRPVEVRSDGYVSSKQCRACHEEAYASWHATYHRRMAQVVTPQTVQADLEGAVLEHLGKTWRFFREGERFFVEMDDPYWKPPAGAAGSGEAAPRVVRPIVLSTGSHHYEAFWFSDETTNKISFLPFCWRIDAKRWMAVDAAFLVPPGESQGSEGRWNLACIKCHATHGKAKIAGQFRMETEVAEFGIACEACHGPGAGHVERYRDPAARYAMHFGDAADDSITDPAKLDPVRASMACGQCHSAARFQTDQDARDWNVEGFRYRPGDDLHESLAFREVGEEKFWDDGMIRTSGREYNALLHTPCYTHADRARGVMTCMSCHQLHKRPDDPRPYEEWADDLLKPGMRGDLACTQCHGEYAEPERMQAHTRHAPESEGSRCMNCHMPKTTYGLLKVQRSHTVASPTLAESLDVGRPNACNLCHLDQTLQWAGEKLHEWYGQPEPQRARGGRGLTAEEQRIAAGVLWITRGDAGQRAIVACMMEQPEAREAACEEWFGPYLANLLVDPYHAVRYVAARALRSLPGLESFEYEYMDEPDARAAAAARAFEQWERTRAPDSRVAEPRVLFGEGGVLDRDALARLVAQRDERRIFLVE